MIGTATALQLARRGHSVCLVDRRNPGEETSYGNAGIVQCEAMVPYPFPREWHTILQAAFQRSTAIHYHLSGLISQAVPIARYWWNSAPSRHEIAIRGYSALITHALYEHQELIAESRAQSLIGNKGYNWLFRSSQAFEEAASEADKLHQRFNVRHETLNYDELRKLEPGVRGSIAGAIHWPDPLTAIDPGALVKSYAQRFQELGGTYMQGDAFTLEQDGNGWRVKTNTGFISARNTVVALGPWSAKLTNKLGYRIPLFIKRGYHRHFTNGNKLEMPFLDAERGYVLAPMAQGIRLTTGVELAKLDAPATPIQMERATKSAQELLLLGNAVEQKPWLGNRPCTSDMLPVLGPAPRHKGLWFNFGHAHQGFTLGPTCGRLMAELIEGRQTFIETSPYSVERF